MTSGLPGSVVDRSAFEVSAPTLLSQPHPLSWLRALPILLALGALALGCVGSERPDLTKSMRERKTTPDGLVEYAHPIRGTLYLHPARGLSLQQPFVLSPAILTYEDESLRLFLREEERVREYVERAMTQLLETDGVRVVDAPERCAISVGLGVVDIQINDGTKSAQATQMLTSWGAFTLVVDLRDATTGDPLARYGRRISLPGGTQWQDGHPSWRDMELALTKLVRDSHRVITKIVPTQGTPDPACAIAPEPEETSLPD